MAVRTTLDARAVVRGLREAAAASPWRFRATCKWVPVDLWTAGDLEAMRRGVVQLRDRIAPTERWRMTLEKRAPGDSPGPALIASLAELVPARVDLVHPDRILLVQLFPGQTALSVLAPPDVFSIVPVPWQAEATAAAARGAAPRRAGASRETPGMPATLEALAASLPALGPELIGRMANAAADSSRPFHEAVDLAIELIGGVVPRWPLLSEWNRWCRRSGASFFVWAPARGELPDRSRADALVHTIMMLSAKEQAVRTYLASGVREAEIAMAGDDCVVCDQHRHRRAPLAAGPAGLPPFHPGCRCGLRPHLG
jgi:hypothetical protein